MISYGYYDQCAIFSFDTIFAKVVMRFQRGVWSYKAKVPRLYREGSYLVLFFDIIHVVTRVQSR